MLSLYLLTAVFALGVLGSIWWFFPRWQLTHFYGDIGSSKDRADIEDNFRKTLSQVFSGLLLIGGLGLTFQQLLDVRKATSEQLLVSRKQQLADQFSKALGHIAQSSPSIRVGGTYSLEEIGRLDSGYHSQIMEVLSEDVRAHALPGNNRDPVVRAGIIVLGRRNRSLDISRPDLRQVDLEAFNFQGLQLRELNLEGANLRNGNLREANIDGSRLVGAKLNGAILERASAIGANFSGAAFTAVSDHVANLGNANFSNAVLVHADLRAAYMRSAKFINADLSYAQLSGADVSQADFGGANLTRALGLSDEQISSMKCNDSTKMPVGHSTSECKS